MEMQWDKVPERLHSESLKCLFCQTMERTIEMANNFKTSFVFCCTLMAIALTMADDEDFKSDAILMQSLSCKRGLHSPFNSEETAFVNQHAEYFLECTTRVLEAVRACPDKPHNQRR